MRVLPAVDILEGRVVQLVGGRLGTEQIVLPDPLEVAKGWARQGAPGIHVIDLDGALGKGGNPNLIKRIVKETGVPVEVGGGVRTTATVNQYLEWGAQAVIVGTRAISDTNWLKDIAKDHPHRVILALDVANGKIQVKGWQESSRITLEQMFDAIRDSPLAAVLHTNVDVEGRAQGINPDEIRSFVARCPHPVIASGGIRSIDDLRLLESLKVEAAVAGLALYTGRLSPAEVWRRER
ncbi:MAG TPA: 1-(5-phosphoribosyl)-5-[(5-phosphoribosylamino)methylideneamino] imidazole-4-carboxamide isomerase [Methanomassiliicoccales archaeon]|jgi:phosphoribosylformimino-5-aminoimidazole carboxamide ribotide isomerase|nr:1-(5-phosphoribosyl)-5-[(5-phosphoribosylamino)methylideneamino] imidazole-4-carboxamide isomerase [Methanomassiliicoccales archaeon]